MRPTHTGPFRALALVWSIILILSAASWCWPATVAVPNLPVTNSVSASNYAVVVVDGATRLATLGNILGLVSPQLTNWTLWGNGPAEGSMLLSADEDIVTAQGQWVFRGTVAIPALSIGSSITGDGSGLTNTFLLPTGGNDDVAINARLALGQCLLGPGTFVLSSPLTVSGSVLSGSGAATIIQVSNLTGTVGIGITNGTLRDLVVVGNGGTNKIFDTARVCAGPNSSVHNLTISNHTYGLDTEGGQNVVVSGLRCYDLRDSQGQAAAFRAGVNSSNIVLTGFYFELCDRGSEVENGAHRVTVQSGTVRDIRQLAGSNSYSFSIDAHTHPGYGLVEDVTYRDIYVTNANAIHIGNDGGGWPDIARNILVENVVFDGPPVANPTNTLQLNHVRDITLRNVRWQGTRNGTNYQYLFSATNVLFDNCRFLDAAYNIVQMQTDTEGVTWRGGEIAQGTNGVLVPAALHLINGRDVLFDAVQFRNFTNCSQGLFFDVFATNVVIRNCSFTAGSACQRWIKWNGKNLTLTGNSFLGTPTSQGVDFGTSYLGTVFGNYFAARGVIFRNDALGFQVWGNLGTTIISDSSLTETVTIYARSNSLPSAATLAAVLGGPGAGIRSYTNALLGYTLDSASNLTWKVLLP